LGDSYDNYFLVETKISQHKKSWYVFSGVQPITHSRLLIFDRRKTVREIKKDIFKYFRPLIRTPDLSKILKQRVLSQEGLLEEEYKYYFENKDFKAG
jgi:hypothetical protein